MQTDKENLEQLNIQIGDEESKGDENSRNWLDSILAPQIAFRRANETFINRDEFLENVKPNGSHRETKVVSIDLHENRAIVVCIVTLKDQGSEKKFHNLRLFVRHQEQWKLLGWANAPL